LVDEAPFPLDVRPAPLPITQWILIDAGDSMINFQTTAQTALERFLRASDTRTGIIFYGETTSVLQPTERLNEQIDYLSTYAARSGSSACIWDALDALPDFSDPAMAQRI